MSLYEFTAKNTRGEEVSLAQYRGKVLLIVNTATGCGFTPQYRELEALYEKYQDKGLEILDFPCNQFGAQAPGTNEEIVSFCQLHFGVKFPQFAKCEVNGARALPLYTYLKEQKGFAGFPEGHPASELLSGIAAQMDPDWASSPDIKWNFTKFLVDREGRVVGRYEPMGDLAALEKDVEALL